MNERRNVIFDSQILNSIQLCGFRTELYHQLNVRPVQDAEPLESGDLLHKMYEYYNKGLMKGGNELRYDNAKWGQLVDAAITLGEFHSTTLSIPPSEVSEVIFQFKDHTRFNRMDGVELLEVEKAFIKELYKDEFLGVYYCGKIDRLTNTPLVGNNVPRDYKTSRRAYPVSLLGNQFTGYAWAMESDYVIVDKVGFQKSYDSEKRHTSHILHYSKFQKEEWVKQTIYWARQYCFYMDTNTWPQNRTSCDKYNGCIFTKICGASTYEGQVAIIKGDFKIGEIWDPTAVLKKKEEVNA